MRNLWIFIAIFMVAQLECTQGKKCGQKKKCSKLKGFCQPSDVTCFGKVYEGKKYCKLYKTCHCCVEVDCEASTLSPCKQLGGRCIGVNDECDGCEVPGGSQNFCKDYKSCKCCFPACNPVDDECYPKEGRCSEEGAYCEKLDEKCKEGYEGVKEECISKDGFCQCCKPIQTNDECYPKEGRCNEKGAYCEKTEEKCKEGYEGVKNECISKDGSCQCCKPIEANDECYPKEGRCNEKGAYCEKTDEKCKEGYEGVKNECISKDGFCQCCKPIEANEECYPKEGRCNEKGAYCETTDEKCKEGYEGVKNECISKDGSCQCCKPIEANEECYPKEGRCNEKGAYCETTDEKCREGYEGVKNECISKDGSCQCCKPIEANEECYPKEGRCNEKGAYCDSIDEKCKEGYEGVKNECVSKDGSCQCCKPIETTNACAPLQERCTGSGEYCEDLETKCKEGYGGKEGYCVKPDGSKCQCCIPK